jgi:uncharacterized membrane protein YdjX (TVP38/TMEM64 family)
MSGKEFRELLRLFLPILTVFAAGLIFTAASSMHAPIPSGLAMMVLIGGLGYAQIALVRVALSTQRDPVWQSRIPLPLRGRWLCYLVCAVLLIPLPVYVLAEGILAFTLVGLTYHP